MNRRILLVLICSLLLVVASPSWARKWTDNTGKFSIEAELVEIKGDKVVLKKSDGSVVTVPIARLSVLDRRYLESLRNGALKQSAGDVGAEDALAGGFQVLSSRTRFTGARQGQTLGRQEV